MTMTLRGNHRSARHSVSYKRLMSLFYHVAADRGQHVLCTLDKTIFTINAFTYNGVQVEHHELGGAIHIKYRDDRVWYDPEGENTINICRHWDPVNRQYYNTDLRVFLDNTIFDLLNA